MKTLPIVLLGVALAVAAAAFFVPTKVYVTAGKQVSTFVSHIFAKKKASPPQQLLQEKPPQSDVQTAMPAPIPNDQVLLSPQAVDTANKLIDTIKNGLGTLATLITVLLGLKQLKPVQEKRRAAKAARASAAPEPTKRTGMKVTSRQGNYRK